MSHTFKEKALLSHLRKSGAEVLEFVNSFNPNKDVYVLYMRININGIIGYCCIERINEDFDFQAVENSALEFISDFEQAMNETEMNFEFVYNQLEFKSYLEQGKHFFIPVSKLFHCAKRNAQAYENSKDLATHIDFIDISDLLVYLKEEEN